MMTTSTRQSADIERIRVRLRQWLQAHPAAPGVVAGVIEGDDQDIVALGRAGTCREELSSATLFEIGSITKALCGSLLARLAAEGVLHLDDPLWRWLPELAAIEKGCGGVTLQQLATHTAGLPRVPRQWAFLRSALQAPRDPYAHYTLANLLRYAARVAVVPQPAPYEYSNLGYALLGLAMERATNRPLAALMRSYIFTPAGMVSATFDQAAAAVQELADGHDRTGAATPPWTLGAFAAAGGIRANAEDILAMLDMARHEQAPFAAGAAAPLIAIDDDGAAIGLGWHRLMAHGDSIVWHNGGTGGFRSFAGYSEVSGRAVVVLANAAIDLDDLALHLLNPAFPMTATPQALSQRSLWLHPLLMGPVAIAALVWFAQGILF